MQSVIGMPEAGARARLFWLIFAALEESCDDPEGALPFRLHDFGARGASSRETAGVSKEDRRKAVETALEHAKRESTRKKANELLNSLK